MFNPIIETAIGLIFVYVLLSMVCSALQEWIATLFGLRAKTLFEGITKMLCGDNNLRDQIYGHPLVDGLSRKTGLDRLFRRPARPSYIAPETFSKAFLAAAAVPEALARNTNPANAKNGEPLQANTQELIAALRAASPGSIDDFRKNVEDWYNDAMDRVSGWYKRKTQGILLILGLIVAIAFNADSLMLARAFWADPSLRAGVAAAAQQYVKDHPNGVDSPALATNAQMSNSAPQTGDQTSASDIANNYPSTTDENLSQPPAPETTYSAQQVERAEQQYRAASAYLQQTSNDAWSQLTNLKVPIGWCSDSAASGMTAEEATSEPETDADGAEETGLPCTPDRQLPHAGSAWLLKISGLLITMITLSQGAPFWFDLLNKVVNLRLAGGAPDEKKK
jgi:hypothetical protein